MWLLVAMKTAFDLQYRSFLYGLPELTLIPYTTWLIILRRRDTTASCHQDHSHQCFTQRVQSHVNCSIAGLIICCDYTVRILRHGGDGQDRSFLNRASNDSGSTARPDLAPYISGPLYLADRACGCVRFPSLSAAPIALDTQLSA